MKDSVTCRRRTLIAFSLLAVVAGSWFSWKESGFEPALGLLRRVRLLPMLCENCHLREASVHVREVTTRQPSSGRIPHVEKVEQHFCEICARTRMQHAGALDRSPDIINATVRIVSVSPERTVLRVVRTETGSIPEEWSVLTSRLPKPFWPSGSEVDMTLTREELAWLKGERDKL
jgi:hypothetical protein